MKETVYNSIVIDTNVLVSALLSPKTKPNLALQKALNEYVVCVSEKTFNEFVEVINRPKFSKYINPEIREQFIFTFRNIVNFIEVTEFIDDCKDPKDNQFLEVAISANAIYLVTGDKRDLLIMNPYRNIEIISVSEFLNKK
ncbi:MAG TPA: putative toxin-antitoxin system toxin component, PIN family [Gallibacterium anatis]|uniref:Toxin-antitoxin system toxin component, PIN family n=1 Tax=Gallibacterium anatis TaxID=750 RepID=A0A921L2H6_9PAST|nr:putative toxin-antitoxin system toxin component, PIN family [Gallibacterium anatis]